MLNQRLQQKLLQKLSPQQILLMKLLQIPAIGMEQRIKQEIEENPALEVEGSEDQEDTVDDLDDEKEVDEFGDEVEIEDYKDKEEEFQVDDYLEDDDFPDYRTRTNNYSPDDDYKEIPFASGTSFHELLQQQLGLRQLDEHKYQIGLYIIGNIDDSGYLERSTDSIVDDLAFTQNITSDKKEVEEILGLIQEFDPTGVGARNLQECLMIQLKRNDQKVSSEALELFLI